MAGMPMKDVHQRNVLNRLKTARGHLDGIIRMVDGKQTVLTVDMNRFTKGKQPNLVLQDRDIVFVPETRRPDWSGKVFPALQSLAGAFWYATR